MLDALLRLIEVCLIISGATLSLVVVVGVVTLIAVTFLRAFKL